MSKNVVVVGAGVSGLQSSLTLLENGYTVTVVARTIPGENNTFYASPLAGANWLSFASNDDVFTQELDTPAYIKFQEYAKNEPASAIHKVKHVQYVRESELINGDIEVPWYKNLVTGFRILSPEELPNTDDEDDKIITAYEFDSVTITTSLYLVWLLNRIEKLGGRLIRKNLNHINEAYNLHHSGKRADLIVNATGLLALKLGGVKDKKMYPIRGQIVRVRNNFPKQIGLSTPGFKDEMFYAFPRKEGGGIIGGTFIQNNWSTVVDSDLSKRILERARKYIPELTSLKYGNTEEIDVIEQYVGLRPARKGGVRIERIGSIIHNYGIGGAGYQASIGLANKVLQLANEYFRQSKL